MYRFTAPPSPAPAVPQIGSLNIDFTWIYMGLGALACFAVAGVLLFMLIRNRGEGASPWPYVGGVVAAIAATFILGTISTNTMWEPLRPIAAQITGPGVVVVFIGIVLFALSGS